MSHWGLCVILQADHLFTNNMAGGNVERALLLMANHVQAANAIYKNTGFAVATKPEGMGAAACLVC